MPKTGWRKKATNQIRSALEFHLDVTGLQILFVVLTKEAQRPRESSAKKAESRQPDAQPALPLDTEPEQQASPTPPAPVRDGRPASSTKRAETRKTESNDTPIPCMPLNERYIFDTFLIGRSNRLAQAGAMHVAAQPGEIYNPLFLYGGPGLGKTHLMQAIAHNLRVTRPGLRITYVSGEYFTQQYITALREHATEDFRRQYRFVDVWLVDDIQFIAGKEQTKEEFFHTFNTLYQMGKQIVLASDRSPRELNTMDERLRSRFQSGLIADIGAPDLETRIAILQRRSLSENAQVPEDVLLYIASAIQSNIRALEGAFTKLLAYSSIMNTQVSLELAQTVLSEYFIEKPVRQRRTSVQEIVEAVSQHFAATPDDIMGAGRNKEISLARQVALYLCRDLMPEMNLSLIGAAFGGRDHATVVYACQKVRTLMELDTDLKALIGQLRKSLTS